MKTTILLLLVLSVISIPLDKTFSQVCQECICGTQTFSEETSSLGTFFGTRYKPQRTDIGGSPFQTNKDYFPILIVFVQFQNEPYSYSVDLGAWNSGQAPNYIDNLVPLIRTTNSSSNWWTHYDNKDVSDYWFEFSRGKFHTQGIALSIILPHTIGWYDSLENDIEKLNKDIYDIITPIIGIDWPDYDKWRYISDGNFAWGRDSLVDMMYVVFRQWKPFLFDGGQYWGKASLGKCEGESDFRYNAYSDDTLVVDLYCSDGIENEAYLGSGVRVHADSGVFSRQRFIDLVTHEHAHYFFGFTHKIYMKMSYRSYENWEFSLSPWEMIKFGYINREIVNYNYSTFNLYDYSSRGIYGADTNEVLQVPISSDGTEFFLLANRRKISEWDKRAGGDTLADDRWQFLKPVNTDYSKGLYIYHVKDGYQIDEEPYNNDIDLECADGLWNYVNAGFQRKRINNLQMADVFKRQYPSYNNDYPDSNPGYETGKDEMSYPIIFTPGSQDNFNTNPISRGTHSLYTNENDYWYSLASLGDRWDAWNVGYNEIFSPYSSPNTKDMSNNQTGIFIWYQILESGTNKATLKIYRTGSSYSAISEDSILHLTPPSRPMGLRVMSCDSLSVIDGYKRIKIRWNHNMEPDMRNMIAGWQTYSKTYKIFRSAAEDMNHVPPDAMQYPEQYYEEIATVNIDEADVPEFTDYYSISACNLFSNECPPYCSYPLRYRVQAIDKYEDESVLSDFVKTTAVGTGEEEEGGDNIMTVSDENIPKEYALHQNFPNPFNPNTNIRYDIPADNFVTIKIFDILGKEVKTFVNEFKTAGSYIVSINLREFSSGIYYYRIEAGEFTAVRKMLLIK